jgi:SAM-dependent methyltransferase
VSDFVQAADGVSMNLKAYERLSRVYDLDWQDFSMRYVPLLERTLQDAGFHRAKILDIACGTGSLLLEMARRGHEVYGIDISPAMLERSQRKTGGYRNVHLKMQDMRCLRLPEAFHLVTCTFDSLNYVTRLQEVGGIFTSVFRHLESGGLFIFDSNTPHQYANNNNFSQVYDLGGIQFIQRLRYDRARRLATTLFEFTDGKNEAHIQRPYNFKELKPLLREAGFRTIRKYGGFNEKRYTARSERLLCIAKKE